MSDLSLSTNLSGLTFVSALAAAEISSQVVSDSISELSQAAAGNSMATMDLQTDVLSNLGIGATLSIVA